MFLGVSMTDREILDVIFGKIDCGLLDPAIYTDAFSCIRNIGESESRIPIVLNHSLMERISRDMAVANERQDVDFMEQM